MTEPRRRYLVVLNPNAGTCAQVPDLEGRLRQGLGDGRDAEVVVVRNRTPEEAAELAQQARDERWTAVVAVGGDGTHHWLVDGLANSGVPLALIPLGTANDLAEEFQVPRQLEEACELIRQGATTRIDLLEVQGKCFATSGGLGLATDVAVGVCQARRRSRLFHALMRLIGGSIYTLYMLVTVLFARRLGYRFAIHASDGTRRVVEGYMALVMNQGVIGKDFRAVPHASNRDGALDLLLIKQAPRWKRLRLLLTLGHSTRGTHIGRDDVEVLRAERLTILTPRPLGFFADGEMVAMDTRFEFRVRREALVIVVPQALARRQGGSLRQSQAA